MKVINDNFNINLSEKTYIALGSFDGLHLGHVALISKVLQLAKQNNASSMVYTFKNHPLSVINEDLMPKLLMNNDDKLITLDNMGLDIVNMVQFNESYMKIYPEEFIKKMVQHYNAKGIVVGFNYRFGYKNLGDIDLIKKLSNKLNFELTVLEPITLYEEVVSSSRIRNLISDGNIEKANAMLNHPFELYGHIVKGKKIGRTIGFPTINLDYDNHFILPCGGVYFTIVELDGKYYKGITNIGYNPTVHNKKLSIETNILNFNETVYGKKAKIRFINRIRDEKKFNSTKELSKQLEKDKNFAKNQILTNLI